ncbi:hypothetical protein [Clostridium sp.]
MNKIEKIKVAVEVALYFFIINTLFYLLNMVLPALIFKPTRPGLSTVLRLPAIYFVSFIVVIIFLTIYSNLLKRKVQVAFSIDNKPLIFIIVGVLLIITGVTKIPMYVSIIREVKDISLGRIYVIYRAVVTIIIYVVQIGIGAYFTFIAIKWDKQIEKIKLAVDVALYYFTITTVLNFLRMILSDLLFKSSMELISNLRSETLDYVVFVVVILFLAILSNFLKRKVQQRISMDSKLLLYLIVGLVLIITGVIEIPPQVSWVFTLIDSIDNYQTTQILNYVYYNIAQIVFFALQIGIGAYFTFMTIRRDKQLEEKH